MRRLKPLREVGCKHLDSVGLENPPTRFNRDAMQSLKKFGQFHSVLSTRKDSQRDSDQAVPQTNTGGLVEYTKTYG